MTRGIYVKDILQTLLSHTTFHPPYLHVLNMCVVGYF